VEATRRPQTQLFDAEGQLNRYVNVYLNDEDVRVLDGLGRRSARATCS
jgi:molybdopterin synthase sulfur carrier subunit